MCYSLYIEILHTEHPGNNLPVPDVPEGSMRRQPTGSATALKLWVVLARAFDAVDRHSRASIARFGLGTTEFGVLEVLHHKGELPVCEVQRRILVQSSSTTYVVDKLVKRGFVRRRPSQRDRRVILLALTAAGRRLINRIFPPHANAMRQAVCALPARDQAQAVRLLRVLGRGAAARLADKGTNDDHD
jgi:MarR family 2-MHQ and catechol resistance regulon transcriptional repressor